MSSIQIIKKIGSALEKSYLEEGFILDKKIGVGQPKKIHKARVLVANTAMDSDKIKIFGANVKVESVSKLAEIEKAERKKMKDKVNKMLDHKMKSVFIAFSSHYMSLPLSHFCASLLLIAS